MPSGTNSTVNVRRVRQVRRTAGRARLDGQPCAPLVPRHAGQRTLSRQVVLADAVVLVQRVLPVRPAVHPERRGLARHLARVLPDGVQREDRAGPDEDRHRSEVHGAGDRLPARVRRVSPPVVPRPGGKVHRPGPSTLLEDRRDQQVPPPHVLRAERPRGGVAGIVQPHGAHQGHARLAGLPRQGVGIRHQLVAQLRVPPHNRFDGRVVHLRLQDVAPVVRGYRGVGVVVLPRAHLVRAPAPGKPEPPRAPVRTEGPAERRELVPARVQLARQLVVGVEAADIRAPERTDAQRVVEADRDLGLERLPRRFRVARPDPPAPSCNAGVAVALQAPRPHVRRGRQASFVVELMALDAFEEIEPVPLVGPEGIDAGRHESRVRPPVALDVGCVQRLAGFGRDRPVERL